VWWRRGVGAPAPSGCRAWATRAGFLNPEGCAAAGAPAAGLLPPTSPRRVAVETYTYELQLALVARERGLGLVPARILARSPLRSRLRVRRARARLPLTIWAVRGRVAPELAPVFDALDRALIERLGGTRVSLRSPSSSRGVVPSRTSRRTAPRHTAGGIHAR